MGSRALYIKEAIGKPSGKTDRLPGRFEHQTYGHHLYTSVYLTEEPQQIYKTWAGISILRLLILVLVDGQSPRVNVLPDLGEVRNALAPDKRDGEIVMLGDDDYVKREVTGTRWESRAEGHKDNISVVGRSCQNHRYAIRKRPLEMEVAM
ncbi:hypothetical protein SISSUDRAFT_1037247 [Sistotremastrum suecicum HHB10207 ss-3]|uniref:Uncharacterized protein n=1 Tax=Sistotremastrum suecicum HHB10207 ss-3 TaxID=1314776 RepID=A0A165YDZ3_9AGAM|nr:hypothetical protein SISSUDRAFT_1037247 [Sistotremastrum suecicum HHB10207 ss-3]